MGLAKILKSGKIILNNIDNQIELDNSIITIPYSEISPPDWGQVYEKYVGQILENEGFNVKYNGLELGFLDKGIDLIAVNEEHINFIQCKFTNKKFTKSKIDWILFKASGKLYKSYKESGKKLIFTIIVSDKYANFSINIPKNFKLNFTDTSKVKFPWLQYYLDHNHIQDKVKLEFREIKMIK